MSETVLKEAERIAFTLRSLYQKYGYLAYKMSKFEEYDLYVRNKEFLVGDGVITFNDTDGKLLALKPDVTLSIIKNDTDDDGKRKVYYNENVYRISAKTKQFKEIMQVGLECIGDIDLYDVYETLCLAAESLATVSSKYVLDVSHLGILSAVLNEINCGEKFTREIMHCIAEKNKHETSAVCEKYGVSKENAEKLLTIIGAYGDMDESLKMLAPICKHGEAKQAFDRLKALCELLENTKYAKKIRLDFSVVNDMNYYNDIVFKGFIEGIGEGVLSGGRYDKLMSRMGRRSGAIGFAVYLDLIEGLMHENRSEDVDVLLLYDEKTDVRAVTNKVRELIEKGKSVRAQKDKGKIRCKEIIELKGAER